MPEKRREKRREGGDRVGCRHEKGGKRRGRKRETKQGMEVLIKDRTGEKRKGVQLII